MKNILLILFCFFIGFDGFSQDSAFYFSSTIKNAETGKPIPNAYVSLENTLRGTYSNTNGEFSLLVNKKRSVLKIAAPWYKTIYLSVPNLIKINSSIFLEPINEEQNLLETKEEKIFEDKKSILIDYDFYGQHIILLTNQGDNILAKITVLTKDLKICATSLIAYKPQKLFTDCRGNHYIITDEAAIKFVYDTINGFCIKEKTPIKRFEKDFYNCLIEDNENTYFKIQSLPDYILNENLELKIRTRSLTYIAIQKTKFTRSLFKNITDEKSMKLDFKEKTHIDLGMPRLPFSNETINYQTVYAPLIKSKKKLVLFDVNGNKLEVYDSLGKFSYNNSFYFHLNTNWLKTIYMDDVTGKFYTGYRSTHAKESDKTQKFIEIKEIEPFTAQTTNSFKLGCETGSEIKINNSCVYYFKRNSNQKTTLCRLKLF